MTLGRCTAGVAILLVAAASAPGCGEDACYDGISIDGPIALQSDRLVNLRVTACRNAHCGSADMASSDPALPPQCWVDLGDGGRFSLGLSAVAPWWLLIGRFMIEGGLDDGDVYVLQMVDTTNNDAMVLDFKQKVTYTWGGARSAPVILR